MDLEILWAEREIQRKLFGIARAMDERNWVALDDIMMIDATADLGLGAIEGRDAIVAFIRAFLDECGPTQHMLGNIVIDIEGTEARSASYVNDRHVGLGDKNQLSFATVGEYRDTWRKIDGRWWLVQRNKANRGHIGAIEVLGAGPAQA